jgi:hypothetical protein
MDIEDSRKCNIFNLEMVSDYFDLSDDLFMGYYRELLDDADFIAAVNARVVEIRSSTGFRKGIFGMPSIPSVDWFAFERILIYVLIRHHKPEYVLETGVYYGGNTVFALRALDRNDYGTLISIDYPDSKIRANDESGSRHKLVGDTELYDSELKPGFIVPALLKKRWELIEGDSLVEIPRLSQRFDFYLHDSDHSMSFLSKELEVAWPRLTERALVLVDDIDWSNAFFAFCVRRRLYPLLMTDNGKDNLRVRSGLVSIAHRWNGDDAFT